MDISNASTSHPKAFMLLILLGLCWGPMPSLMRIVMLYGIHPLVIAAITSAISAGVLTLICYHKRAFPSLHWAQIKRFLFLGLMGAALPHTVMLYVAQDIPATVITILLAVESFIVYLMAASMGLEAPDARRSLGLCFGLTSVILAVSPAMESGGTMNWLLILIALIVPVSYAVEDIGIARMPVADASLLGTAAGMSIAAFAILFPLSVLSVPSISFAGADTAFFLTVVLIALVNASSTVLLIIIVRSNGPVFAGQVSYFMTAGGIMWSIVLLGEQLTMWILASLLCLALGVLLVKPNPIVVSSRLQRRLDT